MSESIPPVRPQTFGEKLAGRPRARFFIIFSILGLAVTPAALTIIFVQRHRQVAIAGVAGRNGLPVDILIAAALIGLHVVCALFAWYYWREEGLKARPPVGRQS